VKRGFTLIELLMVVAIVTTMSVLSAVVYSRFLNQNASDNTVDQIVQTLRKAQMYAMTSRKNGNSGWGVNYTSPTITMYQGSSFGSPTHNLALDETFGVNPSVEVTPFEVNFARASGLPDNTPTISVTTLNQTKTITINAEGVVSR